MGSLKVIDRQAIKLFAGKLIIVARHGVTDLATEHRGVVPREIEFRIGGEPSELTECLVTILVIKEEDESFLSFDQRQYVDFSFHLHAIR